MLSSVDSIIAHSEREHFQINRRSMRSQRPFFFHKTLFYNYSFGSLSPLCGGSFFLSLVWSFSMAIGFGLSSWIINLKAPR